MGNGLLRSRVPPQAGPEDEARNTPSHDMGEAENENEQTDDEAEEGQPDDEAAEGEAPGARKASADEQQQLETFVAVGLKLIYEKTGTTVNAIVRTLSGGGDWAHGLAAATAMVVSKVYMSAPTPPPASVVVHGGKELMTDLVGLAGPEHLKLHTYTPEEIQQAAPQAAKLVMTILKQAGKLPGKEPAAAPGGEPEGAPRGDQEPGAVAETGDEDQGPNAPAFPADLPAGPKRR